MSEKKQAMFGNIFCDKCDNILDISRFVVKDVDMLESDTPKILSSDDNVAEVNYESILKKVESGQKLTNDELSSIEIKDMVQNDYYKKIIKKGDIKNSIIDMIVDHGNSDDNIQAFLLCKNCNFSKPIEPNFCILSKNPEGVAATYDYVTDASYRNKVHVRTIPITRNFNCPNTKCPVYTNNLAPEAIFFRKNNTTYETIYVCKRCLTIKAN